MIELTFFLRFDDLNLLWKEIVKEVGGQNAFQDACKNGHSKMLEMLFQKSTDFNIDLNKKDCIDVTAFHISCKKGHSEIVKILIQKSREFDIKLNEKNIAGETGFHLACLNGHFEIAKLLIQKSEELNIRDHSIIT